VDDALPDGRTTEVSDRTWRKPPQRTADAFASESGRSKKATSATEPLKYVGYPVQLAVV